ncbi:hypothetical protein, partial [Bacillus sonorensis]|uniref:hypothetical protein n=1 Tax=Bacillus sonorensis TaxID=119858 RepID=UPI0022E67D46
IDEVDSNYDESYVLFRKVSASQPSLEDRVSTNEKDIEALKSDFAALKIEAVPKYVRIAKSEAKAGDYVKFDEAPCGYLTAGKYYEIYRVDDCGDPIIVDDEGDGFDTYGEVFEVYRKVSVASAEADPKPERLKVGDYAKVVNAAFNDEDIVEISEDRGTISSKFARRIIDGKTQYVPKRELVRATDEEVAEAKRKQAEEEERKRWAAIGREVDEYKKGDVVAYDDQRWFKNSGIGEVIGFGDIGNPEVEAIDYEGHRTSYFLKSEHLNLVTPVEARFDRKGDE